MLLQWIVLGMFKWLLKLVVLGCMVDGLCGAEERPHIILVMADDQGYGDVGYNGHPFLKTPHLDAMAKAGVVMERFYAAAPNCSPTRASVLTGRHPMRTNVVNYGHYMRPDEYTLAEGLKSAGYVTGHFGKWHIGSVQKASPTSPGGAGFDEWLSGLNFFDKDPYLSDGGRYVRMRGMGSELTMDATIAFLKKHEGGDKPMFVMTWFPSPHSPHVEEAEGVGEGLYKEGGKYRGYYLEIALIDQQVGRLRKVLRDLGIEKNTLVWYCSDNGGLVEEYSGGRAKKGSVYEGGLRVPCIVEWPSRLAARVCDLPMTTSSMYPTLMKLAGAKMPDMRPLDGVDYFDYMSGLKKKGGVYSMGFWHQYAGGDLTHNDRLIKVMMEAQEEGGANPFPERLYKNVLLFPKRPRDVLGGHAAWNSWPWKLHRIERKKGEVVLELYHLIRDPMEKDNLVGLEAGRVVRMRRELEGWQHSVLDSLEGRDYPKRRAGKVR